MKKARRVAAGEKFELLHTNALEEMALATPAMLGDRLRLRTETHRYSIRERHQLRWIFANEPGAGPPARAARRQSCRLTVPRREGG